MLESEDGLANEKLHMIRTSEKTLHQKESQGKRKKKRKKQQ